MNTSAVFEQRKSLLRKELDAKHLDALILYCDRSASALSKWIAGVVCDSAFHYFVITPTQSFFLEISYRAQDLRRKTRELVLDVPDEDSMPEALAKALGPVKRLGLAGRVPWVHLTGIGSEIVDLSNQVAALLAHKSQSEELEIAQGATILSTALSMMAEATRPGISEQSLARTLLSELFPKSDSFPFPVSVVSGPRLVESTVAAPSDRVLEMADAVLIDAGLIRNGFYADCTRMFFTSGCVAQERYDKLVKAHTKVVDSLLPGITSRDLLARYQDTISDAGLPAETLDIPCLGHGIGFALHEYPELIRQSEMGVQLLSGMIFTLEPELVFPEHRIRVEDMILMTGTGARNLTAK